jgi:hypothetical protein
MSAPIEDNADIIRRGYDAINRVGPDGVRDGLIVRAQFCFDESAALEALGAGEVGPPPSAPRRER